MIRKVTIAGLCLAIGAVVCPGAHGADLSGTVTDRSGGAIAGAHIAVLSRVGVLSQRTTDRAGAFQIEIPGDAFQVTVTASGFATETRTGVPQSPWRVVLEVAPVADSVRVAGSTIDERASEQASTVNVITSEEIRERNEEQASDLLRILPGVSIAQSGGRGGVTSAFIRGGDSDYALVTIDGMPMNSFNYGGSFDFAQIPTDFLDRIEVVQGAQSAVYGSYANSGVVNLVTRSSENSGPSVDLIADGGSHGERRFGASGAGTVAGFGVAASASRIDTDSDGNVPNSDWMNENVLLHVNRNWGRQSFSATGNFDANVVGVPGPYGSDPEGLYTGVDKTSRDKNNVSDYSFHYQADLNDRLRGELFGGFFLGNDFYASPYGNSFNKDLRGQAEGRTVISVAKDWTMSLGFAWTREEVENTYVTDSNFTIYPLRRDEQGIYWENRVQIGRFYLQAGVRGDIFETPTIPANLSGYPAHEGFAGHDYARADPKLAVAYTFHGGTRLHASAGTGIRPPGGDELAFTTNPDLKPERTTSVDAGIQQSLASGKVVLNATYFYARYRDLIVSLGGSLSELSAYTTDNLANAKSEGVEFSAEYRPARWLAFLGNYTYLDTAVLALDRTDAAEQYFQVGQQLARRPPQSGSFRLALGKGRVTGDVIGYIRGDTLDVEPNYGVSAGFFNNPGYANLAMNLNVELKGGVTAFGTVRNLLNERYEEIFGFPSPKLTFVSGLKWSFRGRDRK